MASLRPLVLVLVLVCLGSWLARPVAAQAPALTPPQVVEAAPPAPPVGVAHDEPVTVELEVTLDREGAVTDVKILRSAGLAFDAAAEQAVRRTVFEPARRGEEPIPAVIPFRLVFPPRPELPRAAGTGPAPPEPAPPTRGRLSGTVLSMASGEPLPGAEVRVLSADGNVTREGLTDGDGGFAFDELPPGSYRVHVEPGEGLAPVDVNETVRAGEETVLTYRVAASREDTAQASATAEPTFGAVAVVERPAREVTRRTITKEELTRIPGTRGDALRAVELLPGVARPPFGAGLLIVRGSSPDDSAVFFDGTTVPLLYHFGGLTSFLNSRLLEQIDFYPGNFSVRYGRKIGGVLEVKARDPATDGFHGVADLNVLDVSVLGEGPVGEKASVAVAARRSHIDFIFDTVVPDDAFSVVAAPVYWDYQAFAAWRPTPDDRFLFKVFGSSDRFEIILNEASDEDPEVRGDVDLATQFHFAQIGWERKLSDRVEQDVQVRFGPSFLDFGLGEDIRFDATFLQLYTRAEWTARLNERVRLRWGLDSFYIPFDIRFKGPAPRQGEGTEGQPLSTQELIDVRADGSAFQPAIYLESDMRPFEPLQIILGLRVDYYEEIDELSFDPRLVGIYSLTNDWRVKAGVGLFSQPPDFQESAAAVGNPNLEPIHAMHVSGGFEHDFTEHIELGVEGFYKYLWDRVTETPGGLPPGFINEGVGRIYGVEVLGRMTPGGDIPLFGYVSYTLSRSERRDRPGDRWRLFDFDQTHIFTLAAVYKLPKNWEVGATLRLVSGNPDTPIVGGAFDANTLVYRPVFGPINSERNPLFNRLDFRVEKQWEFDAWKLAVYLDIQNLYNAENPEGEIYNFDFSESQSIRGLPIIPALGIRGEM